MPHCLSRWASIACVLDTHMIFNCLIIWTKPLIRVESTTSRSSSTNKKEKLNKETLALKYSKNQLNFNHHVFNYILAKDLFKSKALYLNWGKEKTQCIHVASSKENIHVATI